MKTLTLSLRNGLRRLFPAVCGVLIPLTLTGGDWRQFRGTDISGVSTEAPVPSKWNIKDGENVAWTAELPGRGLSSPIIVGDKVLLTASSGYRQDRLQTLCFDRKTGAKLWERTVWATGRTMCHEKMCVATPTPASDGQRVFSFYSSNDVVCLDLEGNLLWTRGLTSDFPNASNSLGMSSSPVVVGETLVVQVENDADSFATGLDVKTGRSRWKKARPKRANWTSPVILTEESGRTLALLQSSAGMEAVDPMTGETAWEFTNGASTIPSSVVSGQSVFVPSNGLTVLKSGSEKKPEVLWSDNRLAPGTASPIIVSNKVFILNRAGVVNCADALTGSALWKLRLTGPHSATPVGAGSLLVFINEDGKAQVVDTAKPEGEIVGENDFGETILATPSVADGELFVRSDGHLWKIAAKK